MEVGTKNPYETSFLGTYFHIIVLQMGFLDCESRHEKAWDTASSGFRGVLGLRAWVETPPA